MMIDFAKFVVNKFNELSEKFEKKNQQYSCNTDPLANFSTGALLKYGQAGYSDMYNCAKDYARKHIAYIESHGIDSASVEESLGDIAIYAVIMMYMKACYEQERKMKSAQIKEEAE